MTIRNGGKKALKPWIIILIVLAILVGILIVLYFVGKRMQKKQDEQQEQIDASKQQVTLLIIDKKRLPVKESGLPQQVIDQVPKLMRRQKMPIVKVKYGPQVMNMIADDKIFDIIPVKKEVKATVAGIYITDVKALHGKLDPIPEKKKKSFRQRLLRRQAEAQAELKELEKQDSKSKKRK